MNRYKTISLFTLVCSCIINNAYANITLPIPVITSDPNAFTLYMGIDEYPIRFDSNSYDPDNGEPYGNNNGIVRCEWYLYDYSTEDYYIISYDESIWFDPDALGLVPGYYAIDLVVTDDDDYGNTVSGWNYYLQYGDWCGTRDIYVADADFSCDDENVEYGTGTTFHYTIWPDSDWDPDWGWLEVYDEEENRVYGNAQLYPEEGVQYNIIWDGKGNTGIYDGVYLPPGIYTVFFYVINNGILVQKSKTINVIFDAEISKCSDEFMPSGGPGVNDDNTTTFTMTLQGGASAPIRFTLYEVSSEPGYCMNKPSSIPESGNEDADDWKDLQFPSQTGFEVSGSDDNIATTTSSVSSVTVTVKSFDCGAYGKIKAEAQICGQWYTAHIVGGTDLFARIPRDDDNNHIADTWTFNTGDATDDDDTSLNNTNNGDGLTRYEEYRGVDINGDGTITTSSERLNPSKKDLFVQGGGFGGTFEPFSWGDAFSEAGLDVHLFSGIEGTDDRNIDLLVVLAVPTDYQYWVDGGHIYRRGDPYVSGVRDWTFDTPGYSEKGTTSYGSFCFVYKKAINNYFNDKPYKDHNTWVRDGQWDTNYYGNGKLDPIVPERVEDIDDDGQYPLPTNEKDGNTNAPYDDEDDEFDGDYPVKSGSFWDYNQQLSPMDIDHDDLVELPSRAKVSDILTSDEYTKTQVVRHVTTHEMGHAVGIHGEEEGGHCDNETCLMYQWTNNWSRDGHLCSHCRAMILIHNN